MTADARELNRRRTVLLERCAAQRAQFASDSQYFRARVEQLDRGIANVRRAIGQPVVVVAGVIAALLLGRSRSLRLAGRAIAVGSAAWRARSLLASFAGWRRSKSGTSNYPAGAVPAGRVDAEVS